MFERALADNARPRSRHAGARVSQTHGRLLVRVPPDEADDAAARLQRVFGLVSLSVARQVDATADLEAIDATAVDTARARSPATARVFKVEARRADKRFPVTSLEIARRVGARVQAATGLAVDVHTPALRLGIEVGTGVAFVFAGTQAAPGGLPVGRRAARCCCCRAASIRRSRAGWLRSAAARSTRSTSTRRPTSARSRAQGAGAGEQARALAGAASVTVVPFTEVQKRCATPVRPSWPSCSTGA